MAKTFYRELVAHLRAGGFEHERYAKGDHEIWSNKAAGKTVTIDRGVKSRHSANHYLKEAGLKKAF